MTFQEGEIIDIVSKDDMWWTGMLNGKEGVFPANYVVRCLSVLVLAEMPLFGYF